MRVKKTVIMTAVFLMVFAVNVHAEDVNTVKKITKNTAKEIAVQHMKEFSDGKDREIKDILPLYDANEEITSYQISFQDKDGKPSGYVVVNRYDEQDMIREFALEGETYLEQDNNNEKIIYENPLEAYVLNEKNNGAENVFTGEIVCQEALQRAGASTPISSGYTSNPDNYESGYKNKSAENIPGYSKSYYTMNGLNAATSKNYAQHCVPTAATNLLFYWKYQNSSLYGNLCNSTWANTFVTLCNKMGQDNFWGTSDTGALNGIKDYLSSRGYKKSICTYNDNLTWTWAFSEIHADRPFLLMVNINKPSDGHAVLAVGTLSYRYTTNNKTTYSQYIRVVDGGSSAPNRYIHISQKLYSIRGIRVIIKK